MCDSNSDGDTDENGPATGIEMTNLLPEKSRKLYEKCYQAFMDWKSTKGYSSFSEKVLLLYFQELSVKFKSSTLWTFYSMLKSTLSICHQINISRYSKLIGFIKLKSQGYEQKKSNIFSSDEIKKFLNEASDEQYLFEKVALIFGVVGACRRLELYSLEFNDVQVYGSTILVKISNNKTDRCFTVTGRYYDLCKQYMKLRPKNCPIPYFFLNYKFGKCTPQKIGINKLGNIGKKIANYLNLPNPELYTGHCFRRTSANILVDSGGEIMTLKHRRRWKSTAEIEEHRENLMDHSQQQPATVQGDQSTAPDQTETSKSGNNHILYDGKTLDPLELGVSIEEELEGYCVKLEAADSAGDRNNGGRNTFPVIQSSQSVNCPSSSRTRNTEIPTNKYPGLDSFSIDEDSDDSDVFVKTEPVNHVESKGKAGWMYEMESRRVAAEEMMSRAAESMARAAVLNAEAAQTAANAAQTAANAAMIAAEAMRLQAQSQVTSNGSS